MSGNESSAIADLMVSIEQLADSLKAQNELLQDSHRELQEEMRFLRQRMLQQHTNKKEERAAALHTKAPLHQSRKDRSMLLFLEIFSAH